MDKIACECSSCGTMVGEFFNLWTQIGKSYFSPILNLQEDLDVVAHGSIRVGERKTLVHECRLQDIACTSCNSVLGLRCLNTPVNHVLDANQILLRLMSMRPVSATDGSPVELVVKRVLTLRDPALPDSGQDDDDYPSPGKGSQDYGARTANGHGPAGASGIHDAIDISRIQADLEGQREDIDRIDSAGFKIVSELDNAVTRIEEGLEKMKDAVSDMGREVSGNHADITSLKTEMKNMKAIAEDTAAITRLEGQIKAVSKTAEDFRKGVNTISAQVRRDLSGMKSELRQARQDLEDLRAAVGDHISGRDCAKDMAAIRGEMAQLRKEMEDGRSMSAERGETSFPSRELDILTSSIAKIGNRASQVETLQMEFEILKGRVERVEANRATAESRPSIQSTTSKPLVAFAAYPNSELSAGDSRQTRRKRASSAAVAPATHDGGPSKRPAFSSDITDTAAQDYATASEGLQKSPVRSDTLRAGGRKSAEKVRPTKSGAQDKNQRRSTRKSLPG